MGSSAKGAAAGAANLRLLPAAHDQPITQLFEGVEAAAAPAAVAAVAATVGTMTKKNCQTECRHPDESTVVCAEQPTYTITRLLMHKHGSHGTSLSPHVAQHALKQLACRVDDVLGYSCQTAS